MLWQPEYECRFPCNKDMDLQCIMRQVQPTYLGRVMTVCVLAIRMLMDSKWFKQSMKYTDGNVYSCRYCSIKQATFFCPNTCPSPIWEGDSCCIHGKFYPPQVFHLRLIVSADQFSVYNQVDARRHLLNYAADSWQIKLDSQRHYNFMTLLNIDAKSLCGVPGFLCHFRTVVTEAQHALNAVDSKSI